MKSRVKQAFEREMTLASAREKALDWSGAFAHLERAHILGQRSTRAHVRTHWRMFLLGWRMHNGREVRGQVARMIAALLFSRVWVPVGNTGGANVSALRPMPIPPDLQALLRD